MIKEIIKWKLRLKKKLPNCLIFFVTSKCNSKCKMCFYWKELNQKKKELTLEEIKKISEGFNKILWLHLSGGEPFIRDDLSEICSVFIQNNNAKNIAIPTNGLLCNKIIKHTEKILKENPKINLNILLSIDGFEKTHDYIRGVNGNFKKVVYVEKRLSELKKRYPNLSIMICSVVSKRNSKELINFMKFVRENMNADFHSIELMRGDPKDKNFKLPDSEELDKIYEEYKKNCEYYYKNRDRRYYYQNKLIRESYSRIAKKINHFMNATQLRTFKEKKQIIPCLAGNNTVVIGETGKVYLCELLPEVGNLRDSNYNFKSIFYSKKAEKQKKFIKDKKCYCTHCIFLTRSILFNPIAIIRAMFTK